MELADAAPMTRQFLKYVQHPELAGLLPGALPRRVPEPGRPDRRPRRPGGDPADRAARRGSFPGFQNFTGNVYADELRLNLAIPPASTSTLSALGILGGDLAGFPNGRRVFDDVVSIELRAIAGATYPLVNSSYTPDANAGKLTDGLDPSSTSYLDSFPYLGTPQGGYQTAPLALV